MSKLSEIFGRIIGDDYLGIRVADFLAVNPHATANELIKFRGVGMKTAETLLMVMESSVEYIAGTKAVSLTDPESVAVQFSDLRWEPQEHLMMLTLDNQMHAIHRHEVTKGLANATPSHPREILRHAILDSASAIILIHNHPSGDSSPSREDIALTRNMVAACHIMQIPLMDHIIVAKSGFTSISREHPEIFANP